MYETILVRDLWNMPINSKKAIKSLKNKGFTRRDGRHIKLLYLYKGKVAI